VTVVKVERFRRGRLEGDEAALAFDVHCANPFVFADCAREWGIIVRWEGGVTISRVGFSFLVSRWKGYANIYRLGNFSPHRNSPCLHWLLTHGKGAPVTCSASAMTARHHR
jgi:hypothetical protein